MIAMRKSSGNMTLLVSLVFGLIIAVFVIGLTANNLMFQRTRLQHHADMTALELAESLNAGNRIGQIDRLQADSRELVQTSRQAFEQSLDEEPLLSPLARTLMNEARAGHALVERERINLADSIVAEVQNRASQNNKEQSSRFSVPWLNTGAMKILEVELGAPMDALSSVRSSDVISELAFSDSRAGFLDPHSKLFKANMRITLPVDSDLKYEFAPLGATIDNTCSPARNINEEGFRRQTLVYTAGAPLKRRLEHIPTAVQIKCGSDVSVGNYGGALELKSTAITFGDSTSEF